MFQPSGLAHLLAILGPHMGLLCFGVTQLVRFAGAMFPGWAAGVALHKYAMVVGLMEGVSQLAGGGEVAASGLIGVGLEGACWVMEVGILALVAVAEFFAGQS